MKFARKTDLNRLIRLKADFHIHSVNDPLDPWVTQTPEEIIHKLALNNFDIFSITNHDSLVPKNKLDEISDIAKSYGMLFIPGIEKTVNKKHIIFLNPTSDVMYIEKIPDVLEYKNSLPNSSSSHNDLVVIAPHAFYPIHGVFTHKSLKQGSSFVGVTKMFDLLAVNSFYVGGMNYFNNKAIAYSQANNVGIIGESDAHKLEELGSTFGLIDIPLNHLETYFGTIETSRDFKDLVKYSSEGDKKLLLGTIIHYLKNQDCSDAKLRTTRYVSRPLSLIESSDVLKSRGSSFVKNLLNLY
jgi:predicted metal-dependent phosphoesterase TrpH